MKKLLPLCSLIAYLCTTEAIAQEIKTPQEIQAELDQAQKDFETALNMFIPWYTGPLITGSANNAPPGKLNAQVYLFFTTQYAQFNQNRKSVDISTIHTLNPLFLLQTGITDWLDISGAMQGIFRWRDDHSAQEWGDTTATFGIQVIKQNKERPSVRITVGESFPTGNYEHLSSRKGGIDATGSGAYETSVGLNISKLVYWEKLHPLNLRFSSSYVIPNHKVHVRGFHAYGGGFGTHGKVAVGQTLNLDFAFEVSLTQKWVFANDFVYTYSNKSTFSGKLGKIATGEPASNGAPSSDQFSLAPAIEYNISDSAGFIGGIWFTVCGRNSANFVSVVLSYTKTF